MLTVEFKPLEMNSCMHASKGGGGEKVGEWGVGRVRERRCIIRGGVGGEKVGEMMCEMMCGSVCLCMREDVCSCIRRCVRICVC